MGRGLKGIGLGRMNIGIWGMEYLVTRVIRLGDDFHIGSNLGRGGWRVHLGASSKFILGAVNLLGALYLKALA